MPDRISVCITAGNEEDNIRRCLESVKWAFGSAYAEFWHPLTWLSHMLDIQKVDRHPGSFAHPLNERLATSLVSYINYLIKTLWPFHLSILERA